MVSTCAVLQADRMLAAPAEKLIIAGTRPAEARANRVTAAPLALGSITPRGLFRGAEPLELAPQDVGAHDQPAVSSGCGGILHSRAAPAVAVARLDEGLHQAAVDLGGAEEPDPT